MFYFLKNKGILWGRMAQHEWALMHQDGPHQNDLRWPSASVFMAFQGPVQSLSCVRLCDLMDHSTPGLPAHHQLPEFTQIHVHRVGDAIQPPNQVVPFSSCLQSFPESGSFPVSQFFASSGQSVRASASVLLMSIQDWFPLGLNLWPCSPRDLQESSPTPQFKSIKKKKKPSAFFIVQFIKNQNSFHYLGFTFKLLFVIMKLSFTLWFLFGETSLLLVWTSSTFVSSQGLLIVNVKLLGFLLAVYYARENNICKIERPVDFGPDNVR